MRRMTSYPVRLLAWLLATLFSLQAAAAAPEARLDRTRIAEGETVVLSVNVPADSDGVPDLSDLAQDFDILDRSQSMHMSMINGRTSSSRGWQFVLAPKRSGTLAVPAIRVGTASTRPLSLQVLPAAEAAKLGPAPPVSLEVEVEPQQPLVQQQVIYTVRLLSRVPLSQPRLSDPQIKDAIVEHLGAEREYSSQRGGQTLRVIERRYAVFPQRSGQLDIEGPVLTAQVPDPDQRGIGPGQRFPGRDPFADFDRLFGRSGLSGGSLFSHTRPMQMRAKRLTLQVQPQPPGTPTPWLPAESVALNDAWSPDPPQFRVGEPVTRNIAITAQGLSAVQLPDLPLDLPAGIKAYPDKAQMQTRGDGDTMVAQKVIRMALVPAQAGTLTLPEVRLEWWDVATNEARTARLPPRQVEVLPAAGVVSPPALSVAPDTAPGPLVTAPPAAASGSDGSAASPPAAGDAEAAAWPWLAGLLGLAWLVTLVLWWRSRGSVPEAVTVRATTAAASPQPAVALSRIEQVFRSDDAATARQTLLQWAQARWAQDPPRRLDQVAARLGSEAAMVLDEIDRCLYAGQPRHWNGAAAWDRLAPVLRRASGQDATPGDQPLPPLYPQGT